MSHKDQPIKETFVTETLQNIVIPWI